MNRCIFCFALVLGLWGCGPDTSSETTRAAATIAAQQEAGQPAAGNLPPVEELNDIEGRSGQTTPTTSRALQLSLGEATGATGETVCVDVRAQGFTQLIGLQYSVRWDPSLLVFQELKNFQLKFLDRQDFGVTMAEQGILTSAWIDESLQGATLETGASLYQICFQAKGPAGSSAVVRFHNQPTVYEVVDKNTEILTFTGQPGKISIR